MTNPYVYCANNPAMYVYPDGEFWHIVIGAIVGGVVNLASNWKNVDGIWDGLSTFFVGAGAGAAVAATGGAATPSLGAIIGVGAGSGAVVSANNNLVAQTGRNFSGFDNVDWEQFAKATATGTAASAMGAGVGVWASNSSLLVNNVKHPLLRSAAVSPLASGAGHVTAGTTLGVLNGQSLGSSFSDSFDGIGKSMVTGAAISTLTTASMMYAAGLNPITGNFRKFNIYEAEPLRLAPNDRDGTVTLYRAMSGNENANKPLFLTDDYKYAQAYAKAYGVKVQSVKVNAWGITQLQRTNQLSLNTGAYTGAPGIVGTEYISTNPQFNQYILNNIQR